MDVCDIVGMTELRITILHKAEKFGPAQNDWVEGPRRNHRTFAELSL